MSNDPFPRNTELAALVAQARAVPAPKVSVTAQDVHGELASERSRSRRRIVFAVAAAAAILLVVGRLGGSDPAPTHADKVAIAVPEPPKPSPLAAKPDPAPADDNPAPIDPIQASPSNPDPIQLAQAVTIETRSGPVPIVVSTWTVELAAGVYRIETAVDASSSLVIRRGDRVLEVAPNSAVTLNGHAVEVERGQARWQNERNPASRPDAGTLATTAEGQMARGDRRAAIRTLRTLARTYPRAAETRTALVDLAQLLSSSGQPDRARCAYALALSRWPNASIATDIERAMAKLGDGPECRGLNPR